MAATQSVTPPRGANVIPFRIRVPNTRLAGLLVYVAKRLAFMVPVLFFVVLITFTLAHLAPGSPWDRAGGRQLAEAVRHNLDIRYGLDKPGWQQFLIYIQNIVTGFNFGDSYQYEGQSVKSLLLNSWTPTLTIGTLAFIVLVPVGIGLGVLAAMRQNTWVDYVTMGFTTFGAAVPNFVIGIVLIIIFSVTLYNLTQGAVSLPVTGFAFDPQHLVMPVITLALFSTAFIARLTRASTLDTLRQDFVRTAWAKGLRGRVVVMKHVLKNSMIPVVTALGPTFAFLITGSVIVESVFGIPGIGRSFVVAVDSRDYPMILATTILYAVIIAFANLIVDLLYVVVDPRVRLS